MSEEAPRRNGDMGAADVKEEEESESERRSRR